MRLDCTYHEEHKDGAEHGPRCAGIVVSVCVSGIPRSEVLRGVVEGTKQEEVAICQFLFSGA